MYIVSLKHTMPEENYITVWRPDNCGYCYSKEMAGFYENPKYGYHDNDSNMPISEEEAKELFQELPYDGVMKMMIPNNKESWKKLGVRMTKHGLVKINPKY